jgi:hypothetical protein
MPKFDGTGPLGMGPMTGGARGFCSPWGIRSASYPYRRFPSMAYGYPYYGVAPAFPGNIPFYPGMTKEQEIDFLKNQAQGIKSQLESIEARIQQLGNEA